MPKEQQSLSLALRAASPSEAEIVRALLEDEGLFVLIPDRNTPLPIDLTPMDGEYSPTACDVLVKPVDLARARRLIDQAREESDLDAEAEEDEADDEEE